MLIHDRFVFLHLQRTGGTFLADALRREMPGGSLRRGCPGKLHPGWDDIPAEAADLPVLVYVRNPWDWYVSWYHFVLSRRPDNVIFRVLFADGSGDFTSTVRRACRMPRFDSDPLLAPLLETDDPFATFCSEGYDFYTASFLAFVGAGLESNRLTVGRFETLSDDLQRFLAGAGVTLPSGAIERIRAGKPRKATRHRPYREYYDEELRDLVGDSCRTLIDRFSYRF